MSESDEPQQKPPMDTPITSSDDDSLGRASVAHDFAETIRELDASHGLVVGVLGPWGHGKSSFINLMREQFAEEPMLTVVDFNPWMFSGSDQLVNFFLTEIGEELSVSNKSRFAQTADWLSKYAGVLKPAAQIIQVPFAGVVADAAVSALEGMAATTDADRSAKKIRDKITHELESLPEPVVVVIDDIDRLTTSEIREIFKLVRLTASFPNIIYVLAFDRARVEHALTEDGISGRAYLEKIVQLSFDVPQPPEGHLRAQAFKELARVLAPVANIELDEDRWSSTYFSVIDPLLSNMRDVRRYAISSKSTVKGLGDQVDLVDLLAMEAVRIFRPGLVQRLAKLRAVLTATRGVPGKDANSQKAVDEFVADFPTEVPLIRALFENLFPVALQYVENGTYGSDWLGRWRTAHRMAHVDYLSLYLDRVAPDSLVTFRSSEQAFKLLSDADGLEDYLLALDPEKLETVLEGLTSYESKFTSDMVVPAVTTLLNLIDKMPEKKRQSVFDFSRPDLTVGRVVLRLMRRVSDQAEREALSRKIIDGIDTYSSQLDFIHSLGYREGSGHKLVSEAFAEQITDDFVQRLMGAGPREPEREWDAWRIYDAVREASGEAPLSAATDPTLVRSVFRSLKSTSRSQMLGSSKVTEEDRLAWDLLIEVFGSEDVVAKAVAATREELGEDEVFELVDRYLSGWRPKRD